MVCGFWEIFCFGVVLGFFSQKWLVAMDVMTEITGYRPGLSAKVLLNNWPSYGLSSSLLRLFGHKRCL